MILENVCLLLRPLYTKNCKNIKNMQDFADIT